MTGKIRVLIVDDHLVVHKGLRSVLETTADIEVVGDADSGEEALFLKKNTSTRCHLNGYQNGWCRQH